MLLLPIIVAEDCSGAVVRLGLEGAEGVEDGFCADDVATGFGHLRLFEEEPAVGGDGLWYW